VLGKLRSHCEQSEGYLSILEAPDSIKQSLDIWGYSGNALSAMRKLKEQFDPQGVLNTGRFVGGI
jgi:glycolate oxidase FAD binding subunit